MWAIPSAPSAQAIAPKLFWVIVVVGVLWWFGAKRRRR